MDKPSQDIGSVSSNLEESRPQKRAKPLLVGIIVDVSNSMRRNWKNSEGRSLPQIEVIRDTLNRRVERLHSQDTTKGQIRRTRDLFCIGMGFKSRMQLSDVELRFGEERQLGTKAETRFLVDIVCDLLALSDILPTESELSVFKQQLHAKWISLTKFIFDKATIKGDVYLELTQHIQRELYGSAMAKFHRGIIYRSWTWLDRTKKETAHPIINEIYQKLSVYVATREERIGRTSAKAAKRYFEDIMAIAAKHFVDNRGQYTSLIRKHLGEFATDYISLVLRALTLGFEIQELVVYLDEKRAIEIATRVYKELDAEVRGRIKVAWTLSRERLFQSKRAIGASLKRQTIQALTEKCIGKCGWDIIRPLVEETVFSIFAEQFEIQARDNLPYWIRLASTREVIRPIAQLSAVLPSVLNQDIYSDEVMFGTTPFREALDRSAMLMLDRTYKSREKVLVIISDGEFDGQNSIIWSADLLKRRGVTIISCLIANRNIISRLVPRIKDSWPPGAKLMFEIASRASESPALLGSRLRVEDDRLLYQINSSQILDDIIEGIFERPQ